MVLMISERWNFGAGEVLLVAEQIGMQFHHSAIPNGDRYIFTGQSGSPAKSGLLQCIDFSVGCRFLVKWNDGRIFRLNLKCPTCQSQLLKLCGIAVDDKFGDLSRPHFFERSPGRIPVGLDDFGFESMAGQNLHPCDGVSGFIRNLLFEVWVNLHGRFQFRKLTESHCRKIRNRKRSWHRHQVQSISQRLGYRQSVGAECFHKLAIDRFWFLKYPKNPSLESGCCRGDCVFACHAQRFQLN